MAVMEAGSAAHRAVVDELESGLEPFGDPAWRDDLALLSHSVRASALFFARDCEAIVVLAARVPRSAGDERGGTPWTSFVREVAVARKVSDRAAHAEITLAERLLSCHPHTLLALQQGRVPVPRARLLVEECARYDDQVAAVADRLLADRLGDLPPWRIRQEVEHLALRLDPEGAARREATATADRSASLTALPDAQAEAVLTGPAPLVQRWWDALTARARALKAAGDPRSLGALRFDLAVQADPSGLVGFDALSAACGIPDPTPDRGPAASPAPPADRAHGSVTDRPVEPPAVGGAAVGGAAVGGVAADGDGRGARGLGVLVRDDARCSRPVQANITVPAATALGLADEPGWLDGYGWISAPLARRLLSVAELRKACVTPHSGQLIDLADRLERPAPTPVGLREAVRSMVVRAHELRPHVVEEQPRHDPSPALRSFVAARDRWCDGPTGSRVIAARADTDHERAWPTGPTSAWNVVSRAARTHQLKHAGWHPVRDADGTTWTSPAGQVAFTPRFDHPPQPPTRPSLPEPTALAAGDAVLTQVVERPDDEHAERAADRLPAASGGARSWPDDPGF